MHLSSPPNKFLHCEWLGIFATFSPHLACAIVQQSPWAISWEFRPPPPVDFQTRFAVLSLYNFGRMQRNVKREVVLVLMRWTNVYQYTLHFITHALSWEGTDCKTAIILAKTPSTCSSCCVRIACFVSSKKSLPRAHSGSSSTIICAPNHLSTIICASFVHPGLRVMSRVTKPRRSWWSLQSDSDVVVMLFPSRMLGLWIGTTFP